MENPHAAYFEKMLQNRRIGSNFGNTTWYTKKRKIEEPRYAQVRVQRMYDNCKDSPVERKRRKFLVRE